MKAQLLQVYHNFRVNVVAGLMVMSMTAAGCAGGVNLFSKSDDINLGRQIQQEIAADPAHFPVLNDPQIQSYVQGIVSRIAQSPNLENPNFEYQVTVLNDDKTVNAFSIPGGHMYVYTGLLKFIDNESTLAGILAHEITHADHRHATEQLTKQYGLETVASIALGSNPGAVAQIAAQLGGGLALMSYSRGMEHDADMQSFKDLNTLPGKPWYPGGIKFFLEKAMAENPQQPGKLEALFATHPPTQARLDLVNKNIAEANLGQPTASQLAIQQYSVIKSRVR